MRLDLSKPFDINRAKTYFATLLKDGKQIELTQVRKVRTVSQNKYLHVAISLFAIHTGYNLDESKTHLKRCCEFMRYDKDGEQFLKRTRDMDTKQLGEFIDWIITYAQMNGCHIPSSEDYILQQFEIDQEINRHKEYL